MSDSKRQLDTETKRSVKTSAALCSVSLLSCMLTRNIVSGAVWKILPPSGTADRIAAGIAMAAGFFVMMAVFAKAPKKLSDKKKAESKTIAFLFGMLLSLCVLSRVVTAVLTDTLWAAGVKFNINTMPVDKQEFIVWAVIAVIIAPVLEELAFHRLMMGHLLIYGERFALISVTVLFAALHGAPTMWPNALLVGGFIGAAVIYTGSVKIGIALHITNNLIALLESLLREISFVNTAYIRLALASVMLAVGILSAAKLVKTAHADKEYEENTAEKLKAFFINIPMLLIAAMVILTAKGAAV